MDPSEEGAAPLLGINGLVFIGHGRSDSFAIKNAIRVAKEAAEAGVLDSIKIAIEQQLARKVENRTMNNRRVVITGMGAVSVLGTGLRKFWDGLIAGRSGIRKITQFDASALPCQIAGEVPDFDPEQFLDTKRSQTDGQVIPDGCWQLQKWLSKTQRFRSLYMKPNEQEFLSEQASAGSRNSTKGSPHLRTQGLARVNPFTIPLGLPNVPAFLISQQFQCLGPNTTVTTACATGTQAVGDGFEFIRQGRADVVVTGGTEALVQDFAIAGFCAMRALPVNFNDNPKEASRPFNHRPGGICLFRRQRFA